MADHKLRGHSFGGPFVVYYTCENCNAGHPTRRGFDGGCGGGD